ncbi:MAG TPA: DedA family protein [Acidimicrobiia bacterium]
MLCTMSSALQFASVDLGRSLGSIGLYLASIDLAAHWWQYLVVLLAVAASWSGIPFLGATAAGAAGVAASQGHLQLAAVVIVILLGGQIGGLIGYHIGFRWGRDLVLRPGKHQPYRQRVLAKGEQAYEKWGRLAVFFTPSIVSGTAKMPHRQFAVWNFLDVAGFTFATVGAAYGIGRLATGHHGLEDILILVLGVSLGILILYLVRRHRKHVLTASTDGPTTE